MTLEEDEFLVAGCRQKLSDLLAWMKEAEKAGLSMGLLFRGTIGIKMESITYEELNQRVDILAHRRY